MSNIESFRERINSSNTIKGESINLGAAMLDGECLTGTYIKVPLSTLNRHGLITGATGTGKTKTQQVIVEQLSAAGVPVLLMDIKGDLSGLAVASEGHPKIDERHSKIGYPFTPGSVTVEMLSLSDEPGTRLRATVSEFGPVLFSKLLDLNDTQSGVLSVIFQFCDDEKLPLVDLEDLKAVLQFASNEGKEVVKERYGFISPSSIGSIQRRIVGLEQEGADVFFGEPSFEVDDLCRTDRDGKGIVSIVRLTDLQAKPKLFSTFMLSLLAEIYANFPEEGDLDRPKLVIFIDEAHLVFDNASKALRDQLESVVRLIRSKAVGVVFCTQLPADIPDDVLSQLGLKVQHALRAFTAKDRKSIQKASENFPISEYYDISELMTNLGIGEALITALDEKGRPTELAHTMLRAPQSRMGPLEPSEIKAVISNSKIARRYEEDLDPDSALERLEKRMLVMREEAELEELRKEKELERSRSGSSSSGSRRRQKSMFESIVSNTTTRQVLRTATRELARGLLGALGLRRR